MSSISYSISLEFSHLFFTWQVIQSLNLWSYHYVLLSTLFYSNLFYFIFIFYFILFYLLMKTIFFWLRDRDLWFFLRRIFNFDKILNNISASLFVRFVYILENMANSFHQFIICIAYLSFCYNQFKYSNSNIISLLSLLSS